MCESESYWQRMRKNVTAYDFGAELINAGALPFGRGSEQQRACV